MRIPNQIRHLLSIPAPSTPVSVGGLPGLRKPSMLFIPMIFSLVMSCQTDNKKTDTPTAETPAGQTEAKTESPTPLLLAIVDGKAVLSDSTFISIPHYSDPDYTIFYCVRHAEKRKDQGDNPELSDEGAGRAKQLGIIMSGEKLDKVFSTNYKRTIQTAETVRRGAGKHPPAAATYPPAMQDTWLDETLNDSKGGHFLVVGHQNTIPLLLNRLTGGTTYQNIPDDDFDRFYIAITKGIGQTEVVELRYRIIVSQNPATPN